LGDTLLALKALPGSAAPPLLLYALRRTPLGDQGIVGLLLERISEALAAGSLTPLPARQR
jgi:hypothetical protein